MNAIETAVTTAAPKLDSTTIQPPTFSQALLKMYERVSLPAYGPATNARMIADSVAAAMAQSTVSVLTYQDPQQSTKGYVKYCLYASYLGDDVYRIVLGSTIKHQQITILQS